MIRVAIKGGLGNQMFQYAHAKALSSCLGQPLLLDLAFFKKATADRQYALAGLIPDESVVHQKPPRPVLSIWKRMLPVNNWLLRHKLPPLCTVYLDGYWQSEKFFLGKEELIRSLFQFPQPPAQLTDVVCGSVSVAVHVRRGDYINIPRRHICHLPYYHAAMRRAQQDLGQVRFFIFSDDIEWCKELLHEFPDATLVTNCSSDAEELDLMSRCKHIIISNSSFSWWAAWLKEYPGKKVYAPARWVDDEKMNQRFMVADKIVPERWIKIDI